MNEAESIRQKLKTELSLWLDPNRRNTNMPKSFSYDAKYRGIIGYTPSFGSQEFNDHHFHYGHFIYAASILAQHDSDFLNQYRESVELLVKDIANNDKTDTRFPYLRYFDVYTGHSWASGTTSFADGKNQESSSEAVMAWYALYLWSQVTKNTTLETTSLALFNQESDRAHDYWLSIDKSQTLYKNYSPSIVSLVWHGKRDYATWFDAAPESKLAIQLLPFHPASEYLGQNPERAKQNYTSLINEKNGRDPEKFKDYLVMYQALFDKTAAQQKFESLASQDFDSANSQSFTYAWIYTR